jgi:hypothetical protein
MICVAHPRFSRSACHSWSPEYVEEITVPRSMSPYRIWIACITIPVLPSTSGRFSSCNSCTPLIHIWNDAIGAPGGSFRSNFYTDFLISMRDWLNHLYEALNPPFFIQGSPADLDMSLMPFRQDGMKVVKLWIRESFYSLDPFWVNSQFLTAVMRITSLSFAFDRNDASSYISRAKCIVSRPAELIRRGDNRYMLKDLLNSYRGAICSSVSSGILFLL